MTTDTRSEDSATAPGDAGNPRLHPEPVDLAHLARHTFGDRALEREVLDLFAIQARLYLARLKGADGDRAWHDAAHTLKGSARAIGAWRVERSAAEAEALSGAALATGRGAALAALTAAVEEARAHIATLLAGR